MAIISGTLNGFCGHSLSEQGRVVLMDRVDIKFLVPLALLESCLTGLRQELTTLDLDGRRTFDYDTLYFDTPERRLFLDHHNGKLNRFKVRLRHYRQSRITFLEIKQKTNRLRTVKARTLLSAEASPASTIATFLKGQPALPAARMQPALFVQYQRATLINPAGSERITVDTGLAFHSPDRRRSVALPGLAIVEIKSDRQAAHSPMHERLLEMGCRAVPFSKYCVGSSLLFGTELKTNQFKPVLRAIHGLCN
ncbi:polyphosphate polymerase domain-containing protein [Allohahella sp. A8]|uniref:polyphosphate polymerase domain-containing protein n=1 Tax=Allohahella sp. A8 TaxID=3141461 RepID=UPI003A812197